MGLWMGRGTELLTVQITEMVMNMVEMIRIIIMNMIEMIKIEVITPMRKGGSLLLRFRWSHMLSSSISLLLNHLKNSGIKISCFLLELKTFPVIRRVVTRNKIHGLRGTQ